MAPDSRGWDILPFDTGAQQWEEPVVLEIAHLVGDSTELLGVEVYGFGLGVRVTGDEERGDLFLPAPDGA